MSQKRRFKIMKLEESVSSPCVGRYSFRFDRYMVKNFRNISEYKDLSLN